MFIKNLGTSMLGNMLTGKGVGRRCNNMDKMF